MEAELEAREYVGEAVPDDSAIEKDEEEAVADRYDIAVEESAKENTKQKMIVRQEQRRPRK